jgi:hypothetical protein
VSRAESRLEVIKIAKRTGSPPAVSPRLASAIDSPPTGIIGRCPASSAEGSNFFASEPVPFFAKGKQFAESRFVGRLACHNPAQGIPFARAGDRPTSLGWFQYGFVGLLVRPIAPNHVTVSLSVRSKKK